jgi:hypothetical protein
MPFVYPPHKQTKASELKREGEEMNMEEELRNNSV